MRCPRFHRQVVPAVHEELCSRKLLVMEEIHPSIPLHTALDRQAEQIAKKRGITKELFIAQEQVCNPLLRLCTLCALRTLRTTPCPVHRLCSLCTQARAEEAVRTAAKMGRLVRQLSVGSYQKYIRLQKAKRSLLRGCKRAYNLTAGLLPGVRRFDMGADDDAVLVPINAAKLVDDLLAVMGHEVLIDGCFNADPHPGNILSLRQVQRPR